MRLSIIPLHSGKLSHVCIEDPGQGSLEDLLRIYGTCWNISGPAAFYSLEEEGFLDPKALLSQLPAVDNDRILVIPGSNF